MLLHRQLQRRKALRCGAPPGGAAQAAAITLALTLRHANASTPQVRAIFEAAVECVKAGVVVKPDIMVPLVGRCGEGREGAGGLAGGLAVRCTPGLACSK
jgi:hypothetical protein